MGAIYGSVPKFNDVTDTLTVTAVDSAGADKLDNCSAIDVGTGPTDRNAQCVAVKSFYFNFTVLLEKYVNAALTTANAGTALECYQWRILIVLDRQPNKAALTAANIYELTTNWRSPLNLDNRKRIKILKKIEGHMAPGPHTVTAAVSGSTTTMLFVRPAIQQNRSIYMKLKKPLRIEYDTAATTGVIGDIVDNAVSVWFMAEGYDATFLIPKLLVFCRTRFVSC